MLDATASAGVTIAELPPSARIALRLADPSAAGL